MMATRLPLCGRKGARRRRDDNLENGLCFSDPYCAFEFAVPYLVLSQLSRFLRFEAAALIILMCGRHRMRGQHMCRPRGATYVRVKSRWL